MFYTIIRHVVSLIVLRRLLFTVLSLVLSFTSFSFSESEASAQGLAGRIRAWNGLRENQHQSSYGYAQTPLSQLPPSTSYPRAITPSNGFVRDLPLHKEVVPTDLSREERLSRSLRGDLQNNGEDESSSRAGVRGRGIDAVLRNEKIVFPNESSLSETSSLQEEVSNGFSPSKKPHTNVATLFRNEKRLDFIHKVNGDDLEAFLRNAEGLCVVVPLRNFASSFMNEEATEESLVGGTGSVTELVSTASNFKGMMGPTPFVSEGDIDDSCLFDSHTEDVDFVVFTLVNLDEQEELLLKDSRNGCWDDFDLLNASLIAEGLTTVESRKRYQFRFESLVASLLQQTQSIQDLLKRTESVYTFLHRRALYSNYDLTCSSVAASLDSGVFNCVSATVLFNCLASRAGLKVAALETTGHAKSRVKFDNSFLDIETTCSAWNRLPDRVRPYQNPDDGRLLGTDDHARVLDQISPDDESMRRANTSNVSLNLVGIKSPKVHTENVAGDGATSFTIDDNAPLGFSFTRSRRPMREISDVELVATIYYNVGVDYSQEGNFEQSIASYIKAVQLAPDNTTILGNLKATLNNWAIDVAMKEKDFETAILLTELGQRIDPDFREFNMNLPIFFHDWIEALASKNKTEEVQRVKEEYWKRFPR